MRGGEGMEAIIRGTPEELAALVLAVQERRVEGLEVDAKLLAQAICDKDQEAQ